MFARFDENPAMTLQDIKETKRYGRTDRRTDAHTDAHTHARTNNVKTVYPTTNKVCGGYKNLLRLFKDFLTHGVVSGSEVTPCIKIDKPLEVYRLLEKIMKLRF